jgi:2-polyprenyl-3-methyl-5-hydroxy-6-metoxy-1,4-benzoquinol methylase
MDRQAAIRAIIPERIRKLIKDVLGISALQSRVEKMDKLEAYVMQLRAHALQLEGRVASLEESRCNSDGHVFSKDNRKFQFLDIGTKLGDSIKFAGEAYNVPPSAGIGIDLEEKFLLEARKDGLAVIKMNALNLAFKNRSFRFALMLHLLEHLKSMDEVVQAISEACRVSRNFVFLITPNFEYTDYLRNLGLKFSWSDWKGHPCHITEAVLKNCLEQLRIDTFVIEKTTPIKESSFEQIVPFSAPTDTINYDEAKHGAKKSIKFDPPLYSVLECTIYLGNSSHNRLS